MEQEIQPLNPITTPRVAIPIIILVSGFVFFWALGEPAYWDRDEPRNAECAAQMMARGDWIVPTFNDQLRQQKPPLLYWLMGVAYSIFGVNEFSGRFFSALLGVGTVVATWGITKSFFDRATALLASLMLASSLMFCVAARAATPDSVLIFCVTMAIWFFSKRFTVAGRNPFADRASFFGIYFFLGLAMLAKGPVGFLLPMAVMGWVLLQRDWIESDLTRSNANLIRRIAEPFAPGRFIRTLRSMHVLTGVALSLMVAAPWFAAVGVATEGEFLKRFFLEENFGRATKVLENHSGGLEYYPLAILVGFFPWSIFWGPVVADLFMRTSKSKPRLEPGTRLAIAWIVIQVAAFSMVKTKLPSYVTPCYPALAILTAAATMRLIRQLSESPKWLWHGANVVMFLTGVATVIGFWIAADKFEPIPRWLLVLGLAPIAISALGWMLMKSVSHESRFRFALGSTLTASLFSMGLLGAGGAAVGSQNRMSLAETIRQQPAAEIATYGCLESSWIYYSGRPMVELRTDDREDANAIAQLQQRKFWQQKPWLSPAQFAESTDHGLIITTNQRWMSLKEKLPTEWKIIQKADWFLKDEQLLLIGKIDSLAAIPENSSRR